MSRTTLIKLSIAILFLAAVVVFHLAGAGQWLSLDSLKHNRQLLLDYTNDHMLLVAVGYGLVYAVTTALSVPGGAVLSLAGGLLFGRWLGTLIVVLAATAGATGIFLGARYLFAEAARQRMERNPRVNRLLQGFHQDAMNYLLFLRLVPLFPFWLVNLAPAFTSVATRTYVIATLFGIIPGTFVYVNLGTSLGRVDSLDDLISFEVLMGLALLGLFALLPTLVKRFRGNRLPGDA